MDKASHWSITINNPTEEDHQQWNGLKGLHWVREVSGQIEKGDNGTTHIQGYIKTTSVRFSQVKKALPRAHIEIAKNVNALKQYVQKEDTRVSSIPTAKVATQADVQQRIVDLLLKSYQRETTDLTFIQWVRDKDCMSFKTKFSSIYIDASVASLIEEGYYGIEFVMSNNQIRQAFHKYFVNIVYRTYNGRNSTQGQEDQQAIYEEGKGEDINQTSDWKSLSESQLTETHQQDIPD